MAHSYCHVWPLIIAPYGHYHCHSGRLISAITIAIAWPLLPCMAIIIATIMAMSGHVWPLALPEWPFIIAIYYLPEWPALFAILWPWSLPQWPICQLASWRFIIAIN